MKRTCSNLGIREATLQDAPQLCTWWNDGSVMAHAGFPKGLGITENEILRQIAAQSEKPLLHIITCDGRPIGELNYRPTDEQTCEIGIKICDASFQNRGYGKIILSLLIDALFHEYGFQKIVLDTNLANRRAQHVYEQLGFRKLRVNLNCWQDQLGKPQSSVDYELTEESFVSFLDPKAE